MKTCVCLRHVIVTDLCNDDCILSLRYKLRLWFFVRYELRLWLIIMLGIDIAVGSVLRLWLIIVLEIHSVCVVWTEAVVDHAGDPQCYLCGMD
jgi:hypothetical protein